MYRAEASKIGQPSQDAVTSIRTSATFTDIADLGRAAGFDLGFRQLDSGPQAIRATLQRHEHMSLVRVRLNRGFHQLGSPPYGMTTFGIPVSRLRNWFGKDYEASSILPFNLPGGIDGVSDSGFQAFTLTVSDDFVHTVSESCQIPIADVWGNPAAGFVISNNRSTQLVRALLAALFEDEDTRLNSEVENELIVALLNASQTDTAVSDKSEPAARSRAISKAMTYINENSSEAIGVRDICSNTGVALRTLNRAFRERFGIGPKAYLVRQRLSSVRVELLHASADTLVADVANRWGFWHMGQFANDYKGMFGELPSETLGQLRMQELIKNRFD
jgi:AraC-like DNA-binding protein